jgi:hypothetical protein
MRMKIIVMTFSVDLIPNLIEIHYVSREIKRADRNTVSTSALRIDFSTHETQSITTDIPTCNIVDPSSELICCLNKPLLWRTEKSF